MNGEQYTYGSDTYSFSAKYGQSIRDLFPPDKNVSAQNGYVIDSWKVNNTDNAVKVTEAPHSALSVFPVWLVPQNYETNREIWMHATWMQNGRYLYRQIYFSVSDQMLETIASYDIVEMNNTLTFPESGAGNPYQYIRFKGVVYEVQPFRMMEGYDSKTKSASDYNAGAIEGMKFDSKYLYKNQDNSEAILYLLYTRENATLTLNPMEGTLDEAVKTMVIPKGDFVKQSLIQKFGYLVEPSTDDSDVSFLGWYTSASFDPDSKLTDTTQMPSSGLTLYARYEKGLYHEEYYEKLGSTQCVGNGDIGGGKTVSDPMIYQVGQYYDGLGQFLGWGVYNPLLIKYDFSSEVYKDLKIYALWKTTDFSVTYDLNGGNGLVPVDNTKYKMNALVPVSLGLELTDSSGNAFIGWKVKGSDVIYYPFTSIKIQSDTTLVAYYEKTGTNYVNLTYHDNRDEEPALSKSFKIIAESQTITLESGNFTRSGYVQSGWSLTPDGLVDYGFSEVISLAMTSMDLYAVWDKIQSFSITFMLENDMLGDLHLKDGVSKTISVSDIHEGTLFKDCITQYPTVSSVENYIFTHWSYSTGTSEPMYVQSDIVITAHFKEQSVIDLSLITVNPATKTYSSVDPEYTFNWPYPEISQDHFDFSFTRSEGETVDESPFIVHLTITPKEGYHDDYRLVNAVSDSTLTIQPLGVTLSPQDTQKEYGTADRNPLTKTTILYDKVENTSSDFIMSPIESYCTREVGEDVGTYVMTVNPVSNPNYTFSVENGVFSITKQLQPVVIAMGNYTKTYGDRDPSVEGLMKDLQITGLLGGDTVDSLGLTIKREPTEQVGTVEFELAVDPSLTGNYQYIVLNSGTLTIEKRTVFLNVLSLPYDGESLYPDSVLPELSASLDERTPLVLSDTMLNYSVYLEGYTGVLQHGEYRICVDFDPEDPLNRNYDIVVIEGVLTVINRPDEVIPPQDVTIIPPVEERVVPPAPVLPNTGDTTPSQGEKGETPVLPETSEKERDPVKPDTTPSPDQSVDLDDDGNVSFQTWSWINLVLSIITLISAALICFGMVRRKESSGKFVDEQTRYRYWNRARNWRMQTIISGLCCSVVFILTQDILGTMVIRDKWTPLMVALAIFHGASVINWRYKKRQAQAYDEQHKNVEPLNDTL